MEIGELKKTFMQVIRILVHEGLIGAQFYVGCRLDEERMLFIRNMSPLLMTEEDILTVKFEEEPSLGYLAAAIYQAREDVKAVVHAHPPMCIAGEHVGRRISSPSSLRFRFLSGGTVI